MTPACRSRVLPAALVALCTAGLALAPPALAAPTPPPAPATTLVGRAVLPADTFAADALDANGVTIAKVPSGSQISDPKRSTPFADQPVQGFSAFVDNGDGTYFVLPDNGYGAVTNSVDFEERIYRVRPSLQRANGSGTGGVSVLSVVKLADPQHFMPYSIVHESSNDRLLTGDDIDDESLQVDPSDGTFWVGEEFGPFLLHFSQKGALLAAPYELPDVRNPGKTVRSPQHTPAGVTPTAQSSGGLEGLALSPDGTKVYAMLEKATTDDPGRARISEFDLRTRSYTGRTWYYRFHTDPGATGSPGSGAGYGFSADEFQLVPTSDGHLDGVVLERDSVAGQTTTFRRVYEMSFGAPGTEVASAEVADLERINDPGGIATSTEATPGTFAMPFTTIEDLVVQSPTRILVGNDNNYPFDAGRTTAAGTTAQPDGNEFVQLDLAAPLGNLAGPAVPTASLPELPLAAGLPVAGLFAGLLLQRRRRRTRQA